MNNGFRAFRIGPDPLDIESVEGAAIEALSRGASVVLYSALGPSDRMAGWGGEALGQTIGDMLKRLLLSSGVRRAVVSGGDTSSHSVRRLDIQALTFAGLLTPGSPLCRAHAPGAALDGIELVLKGGQMGPENFFDLVRRIHP
jgi:uncharacterized protein YgbK (DUF1537 family)